jgi:knotted carbamoyltransferase YgeW
MLLKNCTVAKSSDIVVTGDVLIENGKFSKVGGAISPPEGVQVVDCHGKLILPGLINAHSHFYGRPAQGIALKDELNASSSFLQILERLWWKLDRALTQEAVDLAARVCMIEALEAGTTCIFDHHSSPNFCPGSLNTIGQAASALGINLNACYETSDRNGSYNCSDSILENVSFHTESEKSELLSSKFGLHAAFTCSDKTLARAAQAVNEGFHVHVAEGPVEDEGGVARLAAHGLLGPKTILGHCVHVTEEELQLIAASKSTVVVNLQSNLNNHVGLPKIAQMMSHGIRVGLGTDGMTQDMLAELRVLMLHATSLGGDALKILLDNNAALATEAFGRKMGQIEEGYAADAVLFDYVPCTPLNGSNLAWHLQFGVKKIDRVLVNGRVRVENGSILNVDKHVIWRQFRSVVESVVWTSPELDRFPDTSSNTVYGRDFLRTWDFSVAELTLIAQTAKKIRAAAQCNKSCAIGKRGLAVANFRDKSTRTRLAFASACSLLDLNSFVFDEATSQVGHGETIKETSVMLSFATEVIGIRDDIYVGKGEEYMRQVVASLVESHAAGILRNLRPTIVNLQSDVDHPTQTMSDLLHLFHLFGPRLHQKKICISWAYSPSYGKPLSVPGGLIALLPRFGMDVTLAHPEGFEMLDVTLEAAKQGAREGGGSFRVVKSMAEGIEGVDVVYAKSWGSLQFMKTRVENQNYDGPAEKSMLERLKPLAKDWEYNEEKAKLAPGASYMHCLPADISGVSCQQGEVAAAVFEKDRLNMYREASWKPFVCSAVMTLQRVKEIN